MKHVYLFLAMMVFSFPAYAAKTTSAIDDNETVVISSFSHIPTEMYEATVIATGTFGSGTISWSTSYSSSCATKYAMKDFSGTAVTSTANDQFNVTLGNARENKIYLCATMAGATSPDVAIYVNDNQ